MGPMAVLTSWEKGRLILANGTFGGLKSGKQSENGNHECDYFVIVARCLHCEIGFYILMHICGCGLVETDVGYREWKTGCYVLAVS
jgi:hypothetical protein